LDDLNTVTQAIQDRIAKLASTSKSGTGAIMLGQFGMGGILTHFTEGGWNAVSAALYGAGGPWAAAHALTDPRFVRAMVASAQKFGDGIDSAGRAVIDLGAIPRAPQQRSTVPQQVIDQTPKVPISQ
jgi:hypothetical protein